MAAVNFADIEDEITRTVQSVVARHLDGKAFRASKVKEWVAAIGSMLVKDARDVSESFKYMSSVLILQNNGAGLTSSSSCFFDCTTDGSVTVRWENKAMCCIVTMFATAL